MHFLMVLMISFTLIMACRTCGKGPPITVDTGDLTDYVGQPPFTSDRIYGRTPAGVVMGLAWTSMGGNALYIEAAMVESGEGKGGIRTTGA